KPCPRGCRSVTRYGCRIAQIRPHATVAGPISETVRARGGRPLAACAGKSRTSGVSMLLLRVAYARATRRPRLLLDGPAGRATGGGGLDSKESPKRRRGPESSLARP